MELDQIKKQWQQVQQPDGADNVLNNSTNNKNIEQMIHQNSQGPLASLKLSYRRQMAIMGVLPIVLILTNLTNIEAALSSIMFWSYVAFCFVVVIFAAYNYRIVQRASTMQTMVKPYLEQTIRLLESGMRRNVMGVKIALLFFIVLTELLPYVQHFVMLDKWHALSPFIRYGTYGLLVLIQHFSVRRMSYLKFGQHIDRLKYLASEME